MARQGCAEAGAAFGCAANARYNAKSGGACAPAGSDASEAMTLMRVPPEITSSLSECDARYGAPISALQAHLQNVSEAHEEDIGFLAVTLAQAVDEVAPAEQKDPAGHVVHALDACKLVAAV